MISDFYKFGSRLVTRTVQVDLDLPYKKDNSLKDDWIWLLRGEYAEFDFPINAKKVSGQRFDDILDTGFPSLFLVSKRFIALLEEIGATGWTTYPVIIRTRKGLENYEYLGFSVVGKCGQIDYIKSTPFEKKAVPNGPLTKYLRGRHIGLDDWDGSDFFSPQGNLGIVVTKRIADQLKAAKISNLRLKNLTEIEEPLFGISITTKGEISEKDFEWG